MSASDFFDVNVADVIQVISALVMLWVVAKAPEWAVNAQWQLQLKKEQRDRRLWIFKTLMRTRATTLSADHVQALNLIDVEFSSTSAEDAEVRNAWHKYLEHLKIELPDRDPRIPDWSIKGRDLLAELLSKMGQTLGYNFDFTYIKENGYYPKGHGEMELVNSNAQKGWAEIVSGDKPLKMEIVNLPSPPAPQNAVQHSKKS